MSRRLLFVWVVLAGGMLALVVSFGLSVRLAESYLEDRRRHDAEVRGFTVLQQHAGELLALNRAYLGQLATAEADARDRWIDRQLKPRLRTIREGLAEFSYSDPIAAGLREATDRLAESAARPDDPVLRDRAAESVLTACGFIEDEVVEPGSDLAPETP